MVLFGAAKIKLFCWFRVRWGGCCYELSRRPIPGGVGERVGHGSTGVYLVGGCVFWCCVPLGRVGLLVE